MRAFTSAILLIFSELFILSGLAAGQTTAPAFAIADVHLSKSGAANQGSFFSPGGRYSARGATMLNLIQDAYGVEPEMIVGGPNWLDTTKFDITARPPAATDEATAKLMLQTLLADRFKLQIHKDQKAMSSYVLRVSKRGLKIQESGAPGAKNCDGAGGGPIDITFKCTNMTMADLATQVRQNARAYVDQPVIDKTGLTGAYDFTLSWTGKNQLRKPGEGEPDKPTGTSNTSVFDALDKQLGLKLELQKEPVSVIVIDAANEKPIENAPEVISKLPKDPTEFEVAEITPSAPGTKKMDINFLPGGRLDLKGVSIKFLLTLAYGIQDDDMLAGPKWIDTEKFDIVAKAPVDLTQDVAEVMLRNLLADRFKFKMHYEERPVQVYALVVSKKGLKIKESAGDMRANCKNSASNGKRNFTCQNTDDGAASGKAPPAARHISIIP